LKFSFIIPTYNRCTQLDHCVASIINQSYTKELFEIIVVNDGGEIPMLEHNNLKIINQPNAGPATARNTGANAAQGEYLIFVDDDCCLDTDWLAEMAPYCKPNTIFTGFTINKTNSIYSEASQLLVSYLHEAWQNTAWHFFASNNLVINNQTFNKLKGFNEQFPLAAGEDREICFRAKVATINLLQIPTAIVFHYHHLNFNKFIKQHLNYGKGAYYFNQVFRSHNKKIPIQPIFFYKNMLYYPFTQFKFKKASPIFILIVLSQFLNILGYLSPKNK
jgi:glycosyltransferase involved in cell wall biosynthesis